MMDRFILFAGKCERPNGGFGDYISTFPSAINAYNYVQAMNNTDWEWYEIVEIKEKDLILVGNEHTLPKLLTEK
jgi:hypothetical protein